MAKKAQGKAQQESKATAPKIEHVVVLAMENRSFDHMLGYLEHPNRQFDGLTRGGPYYNLNWEGTEKVDASPVAKPFLPVDPDHSHDAVMEQLALSEKGEPTNEGFVSSYERKGRNLAVPAFGGLLAPAIAWSQKRGNRKKKPIAGRGPLIMECQPPENVPVLSTLAREFAVCTRWFCSVPGETWPNRNFMHAATSDGETNIDPRFYTNKTIFESLEDGGKDWHIYYDDTPQVWAFVKLWKDEKRRANWFDFSHFSEHVSSGLLPAYSFIEPNHRPPYHLVDHPPVIDKSDASNNQHPGNNLVKNDAYDTFQTDQPVDFVRGEALIAKVYETLRGNPELFAKTLLVITYDEHGGFYDHVSPHSAVPNPGSKRSASTDLTKWIFHRKAKHFDFSMTGLRVPTILVSPLIDREVVSTEIYEHSSIPATLRKLFAPGQKPLTARDEWAATFDGICTRDKPRVDLPDLSSSASSYVSVTESDVDDAISEMGDGTHMPDYYDDLVTLSDKVGRKLEREGVDEARIPRKAPMRLRAHRRTHAFRVSAHKAREQQERRRQGP